MLGCARARGPHVAHRLEVGGLDNQRVAFPVTAGVAFPLRDVCMRVGPSVNGDDPRVVDQLAVNDDVALGLHEQFAVVIGGRHHHPEHAA